MTEPTPEPDPRFVTLGDLKDFLKITGNGTDALLNEVLDAALELVDHRVYLALDDAPKSVKVRATGRTIVLPIARLEQVTAVTTPDGTALAAADLDVDLDAGLITVPRAHPGTWTVTVHAQTAQEAGAAASLRQAVKIIAKHLWGTQRGSQGGPRGDVDAQQGEPYLAGFAIPRRAAELMAPWTTGGGFA